MRISPYLYPCCSVLAARFSNITKFECSHRRAIVTYSHDIFHNEYKRPHHATWEISHLYIENKYHHLTLENKFRLLLNKGVHIMHRLRFLCEIRFKPELWRDCQFYIAWAHLPALGLPESSQTQLHKSRVVPRRNTGRCCKLLSHARWQWLAMVFYNVTRIPVAGVRHRYLSVCWRD